MENVSFKVESLEMATWLAVGGHRRADLVRRAVEAHRQQLADAARKAVSGRTRTELIGAISSEMVDPGVSGDMAVAEMARECRAQKRSPAELIDLLIYLP